MQRKSNCEAGHESHDTLRIDIHLKGEHHGINDVANIPDWYDKVIKLEVFDWKKYLNTNGYCPADTEVSRSIYCLGIWESFETLLMLDILRKGNKDNLVIDIGANIGWYSALAALEGYHVEAYDNDPDIARLFFNNVQLNNILPLVWLGDKTFKDSFDRMPLVRGKNAEYFKCDIEGSERWAYNDFYDWFVEGRVNNALFEISPCFNNSYPDLVEEIASHGYDVYQVPQKGFEHIREFEQQPLETLKKYCIVSPDKRREYVASLYQENFLFIKR